MYMCTIAEQYMMGDFATLHVWEVAKWSTRIWRPEITKETIICANPYWL